MMRSPSRSAVSGVCSAGFRMHVQPAASAGPSFHAAITSGKFHGMICATTPTGSRRVYALMRAPFRPPTDTSIVEPSIFVAQPAM